MHKCIIVKVEGKLKTKKSENMGGEFRNLAEIGGNMQLALLA